MSTSQNGWTVIPGAEDKSVFPGTNVKPAPGIKGGDVATVLHYVGEQFNKRVEPLHEGWCWGYANKTISGSSTISNHASGTAIDLNAPNHPQFKPSNFSAAQTQAIHDIVNECDGVVRWGGDYEASRIDSMHFEINAPANEVARVAAKLRGDKPTPAHAAQPAPKPVPKTEYVQLPASVKTWATYPDNGPYAKVKGKYIDIKPAQFGGLEYAVKGRKANGSVVLIDTKDYGRRAIWVQGTSAKFVTK